jgi:hypothetical protein
LTFCREVAFKALDKGLLEVFGPYSITNNFSKYSQQVSNITSGYIYHYSFLMLLGVSLLFILTIFSVETISFELLFLQIFLFAVCLLNFKLPKRS